MPEHHHEDPFEAAYTAPVLEATPPPGDGRRELLARAAAAETFALHGCVLTPDRAIENGYVVIEGKQVHSVTDKKPADVPVQETEGVITPGLIDLHGHPEFNVFAPWEPPRPYDNRYEWRGSDAYHELVRDPQNKLIAALDDPWTELRYAEIRALVGGVTAIQGTGGQATAYQDEALVRNVDKWIFGGQVGRSMIDLPSGSRGQDTLDSVLEGIKDKTVKAFYVHLAEGKKDNERSQKEFKHLVDLKALTASTVVIHGTALTKEQLGHLKDGGAKLVWSPQSNLRLYGETTSAADAIDAGLPLALGADWLPSGSQSLLAEIKVARHSLVQQGHVPKAKDLVQMVTRDAAEIAGLGDKLGTLAKDRPADLVVFERWNEDPWENVVAADPSGVELVMIDGDLTYGRADWMKKLAAPDDQGRLEEIPAYGQLMALDTSYTAGKHEEQPTLAQLREQLVMAYPHVGPIFV